jgi:DNA-directed RNA polymerase subunit RPC12/RpoP
MLNKMAGAGLFRCTYAGCNLSFDDADARTAHKDLEHDYCMRCNVDFPNHEALLKHKIESVRHIVCPICGMEFGGVAGRDQHVMRVSNSC